MQHVARVADDYRGPYKRHDPEAGAKYACEVAGIIAALEEEIARFEEELREKQGAASNNIGGPRRG